jgi:hypothetical protein
MITINCNSDVVVKLTPYGKNVWNDFHTELGLNPKDYKYYFKKGTKYTLIIPIWELMNIFGKYMFMGNPDIPFVNNEIKMYKDDVCL